VAGSLLSDLPTAVGYTRHYTPAELLNLLPEPSLETKKSRLFIGNNGPDVWQFSDHILADFVMDANGNFTMGDWDHTPLTREQYWESINWVETTPSCPVGQHWDGTQCVPDVVVPPSGMSLRLSRDSRQTFKTSTRKVTATQQAGAACLRQADQIFK
jgi:hypothetical protein